MNPPRSSLSGIAYGLGLAVFAAYHQFKLAVVLPVLLQTYGYDRVLAGAFMSIYSLAGLLLSIPLGRLIARRGSTGPVLAAMALQTAGTLMALAWPESGAVVLGGRGLEGVAFAILAIAGPVLASGSASPHQLPLVAGLVATWIPLGQLIATLLAPVALATVGWQLLWYLGIAGAAVFALWTLRLAASGGMERATGVRAGTGSAVSRDASSGPLTRRQRRSLTLAGAVFMLWSGQYVACMTWLPQYLVEVHHVDAAGAAWGYLIPVVLVATLAVVAGLMLRAGVSLALLLTCSLLSQALVWWLLPVTGGGLPGLLSLVVYGTGGGIVPTCLFALPSAILGRGHGTARAFGIVMTGRNLGVLVGPVLLAELFKLAGSWVLVGPVFGAITTLCLALAGLLALRLGPSGTATAESP